MLQRKSTGYEIESLRVTVKELNKKISVIIIFYFLKTFTDDEKCVIIVFETCKKFKNIPNLQ